MSESNMTVAEGEHIRILFDAGKCIHSRQCVLGRPEVFVPNQPGEWIFPDRASVEAVVEVAHACPSGAIRYERKDGGPAESAPPVNLMRLRENGPLAFHGELVIAEETQCKRATLCRCGDSHNKPFCDGSHVAAGFQASGEVPSRESQPLAVRNGELRIAPAPNGPLLLEGNLEVCTGTGRTVDRLTKTALCRCGASQNKPFCDGSHARIGFKA